MTQPTGDSLIQTPEPRAGDPAERDGQAVARADAAMEVGTGAAAETGVPSEPCAAIEVGAGGPRPGGEAKHGAARVSRAERTLLLIAFGIGVLCDRLLFSQAVDGDSWRLPLFSAIFWLVFLLAFHIFFQKRIGGRRASWTLAGFLTLLCLWNFFHDYQSPYGAITFLVIPAAVMAHVQLSLRAIPLKAAGELVISWLLGWFAYPFTALYKIAAVIASVFPERSRRGAGRALAGILFAIPLALVILALLGSADKVFSYYLSRLIIGADIAAFLRHAILACAVAALFFSVLWNAGFRKTFAPDSAPAPMSAPANTLAPAAASAFAPSNATNASDAASPPAKHASAIDPVISCIGLAAASLCYALFCLVQFTYLFARAGLPNGLTYSEYAREGFAQIIVVCGLNILLFGIVIRFGRRAKSVDALLAALLGLTTVTLASGFVRLRLYIDVYGLTWLRLLSTWFIVYLFAVLALCAARMLRPKLPLVAVCAFLLIGWYTVLGYADPDALIARYNLENGRADASVLTTSAYADDRTPLTTSAYAETKGCARSLI
jgi:hypothetical protein